MSNGRPQIAREYLEAVYRRGREPMEPAGFVPNPADQPSRYKTYPGAPLIPLPETPPTPERSLADVHQQPAPAGGRYTVQLLAWLLRMSYGLLDRRLRLNWNQDDATLVRYPWAMWGRGTPSGGGLYPLEIYWLAGGGGHHEPGIYHYATGHHALERLVRGTFTNRVRSAVQRQPDALTTDQFLLVTVRFWKNAFKYNNFSYHVVTQDLGALLGSWDLLGAALGIPTRRILWFDDEPLNELLGVDTAEESVFAVLPLPWAGAPAAEETAMATRDTGEPVPCDLRPFERSRTVLRFPRTERVHRAALLAGEPRPAADAASDVVAGSAEASESAPAVTLPAPLAGRLGMPASALLARRRSSFGGFSAARALEPGPLGTVLAVGAQARSYRSDLTPDTEPAGWTGLFVFANQVAGLPRSCFRYDNRGHRLLPAGAGLPDRDMSAFLQRSYYLTNYNLDQVAAVVAISGRPDAMLARYGNRGYRILNAETGSVGQAIYLAAAALGLGCGAVLGFDNPLMDEALGIAGTDERTLLYLLLGNERPGHAAIDYRLL